MPFIEDICVVVECDGCGDGWAQGPNDYTPHFTDYDTARQHLLDFGWTIEPTTAPGTATAPRTATTRLVCPDCTRLEACARRGHAWGPWNGRDLRHQRPDGRTIGWAGRVRACGLCPDTEWDPPLGSPMPAPGRPALTLVTATSTPAAVEPVADPLSGGGRS